MRRPHLVRLVALLAIGLGSVLQTWGITIRHDKQESAYRDLGSKYSSVGKLNWTDGGSAYFGSGTLIAPDWVLTAGHCTDGDSVSRMSFALNGKTYTADEWIPHPLWSGNLSLGYDIGLVRLSTSVTDVAPAQRFSMGIEQGKVATSVGYGLTGTGQTGYTSRTGGTKRAGQNVVDALGTSVGMSYHYLISDFDDPSNRDRLNAFGSGSPLGMEFSIAPGDSGGGTFIDVGGVPMLAGVNSFISSMLGPAGDGKTNASYSDFFGSTRVLLFNDWIDSYVAGSLAASVTSFTTAATVNTQVRRTGTSNVPEPGAAFLAALAIMPFVGIRRRRRGR